jgi:glyoxylase-like metal-dependent hydrolase (beta-lactamase superfamily II)
VFGGLLVQYMKKPLLASLKEIGAAPADIQHLAMSHMHGDHTGNANYFTAATLYIQGPEYDIAFGPEPQKSGFTAATYAKLRDSKTVKLSGDHDVFGDGSVVILSTPGHTPGHQSLLVRLPKTGALLLSGDVAHFQSNWDNRRVPAGNFDRERTLASMARVEELLAQNRATLVIQHDQAQSARLPKAPAFLD